MQARIFLKFERRFIFFGGDAMQTVLLPVRDWRPIEEAPKDGRSVLLWARLRSNPPEPDDFYPIIGFWHPLIEQWKVAPEHLNSSEVLTPSHWADIPEAPKS